ncbi:MAG: hypothetical protein IJZ93_02240 [Clostridia bacterium]|nr:hypothetical protein [Clostridia bacterium]
MLVFPTSAENTADIGISSVSGFALEAVKVDITFENKIMLSAAQIRIEYDDRLELVKAESGTGFTEVFSNSVTGMENGEYTFIALAQGSQDVPNTEIAAGSVVATLTFVIPKDAKEGDEFDVAVNFNESEIIMTKDDLTPYKLPITSTNGKITYEAKNNCGGTHAFGDTVEISKQTHITYGYSYKICTACSYTEVEKTSPLSTNIITPVGTAIKYTGTPRGIGAAFNVDKEAISAIEELGYTVEIGTQIVHNQKTKKTLYYGAGTSNGNKNAFEKGVIFDKIEEIGSYDEVRMCGYVKIIDSEGSFYEEKTYVDINGDIDLSISDVVSIMTISKYDATSREYLNAVLNGIAQ